MDGQRLLSNEQLVLLAQKAGAAPLTTELQAVCQEHVERKLRGLVQMVLLAPQPGESKAINKDDLKYK